MMSVASSTTPAIDWNSCSTPSMRTAVTAAPSMDESRVRRSALPMVVPKSALEGLSAELTVLFSERLTIDCETLGLLESSPKHVFSPLPS